MNYIHPTVQPAHYIKTSPNTNSYFNHVFNSKENSEIFRPLESFPTFIWLHLYHSLETNSE